MIDQESMPILIPTRGRPQSLSRLLDNFFTTYSGVAFPLILLDDDDPTLSEYYRVAEEYDVETGVTPRLRLGGTLNHWALKGVDEGYPFIGWLGDDTEILTEDWDYLLAQSLESEPVAFAYGNDHRYSGTKPEVLITMTFSVVKALGYMCPPELKHFYLDNAWQAWADETDTLNYVPSVVHTHLHHSYGKAELDQTYRESIAIVGDDENQWAAYCSTGGLERDVAKLKELL